MIIIGLGNPGLKYRNTRHNVGHLFVDRMAKKFGVKFKARRGYRVASIPKLGPRAKLAKPVCFMNTSGPCVRRLVGEEGPDDFMVVLDDINLPLGRIRLRGRGSDGGHLGLRSIISELGTEDFCRLRIGVGRPSADAAEYVLAPFDRDEKKTLSSVLGAGIAGVEALVARGLEAAQNLLNCMDLSENLENKGV